MNPFRRLLDFISIPSHSRTIGFLAFLTILLAIPLTVNIAQKQQELRQRAAFESGGETCVIQNIIKGHPVPSGCEFLRNLYKADNTQLHPIAIDQYRCNCPTPKPGTTSSPSPTVSTTPLTGCEKAGGQCVDQGYYNLHSSEGSLITESCYAGDLVCFKPAKPCGNQGGTCRAGVCVVGPNQDTIDANGSVDCKTGGGAAAPICSTGQVIACLDPKATPSQGCVNKNVTLDCGVDKTTYCCPANPTPITPAPVSGGPTSTPPASCDNSKGYVSSCAGVAFGTIKDNPAQCTQANGKPGKSVMECQGSCWYDSYYDSRKAPASQWCYPVGVQLAFTVGLDGIGLTGDQKNPNPNPISNQSRGSNKSPKRAQRAITVEAIASDNSKTTANGTITYDSQTGKYNASVNFANLKQGVYAFKVKADNSLRKTIASVIGVSPGQTVTLPDVNLVTGDIDNDNRLTVTDYNFFSPGNCLFKAASGTCSSADLNDDGVVDQYDYNLFLREIAVVQDGE